MLQSPVLSKASEAVRSRLDKSHQESDNKDSPDGNEREPEAEQASCRCPNCEDMTDIEGIYILAPNEEHIEPCSNCGMNISMEYDQNGDWTIEVVGEQAEETQDEELSTLSFQ